MFSSAELTLIRDACKQRARQWQEQAMRMEQADLRDAYRHTAAKFEDLARRAAERADTRPVLDQAG
jgi:hypothetical protein